MNWTPEKGGIMITKGQVRDWMRDEVQSTNYYFDSAGEVNSTLLAESAAEHFDHQEWLDDETHFVWDAAAEVAWEMQTPDPNEGPYDTLEEKNL